MKSKVETANEKVVAYIVTIEEVSEYTQVEKQYRRILTDDQVRQREQQQGVVIGGTNPITAKVEAYGYVDYPDPVVKEKETQIFRQRVPRLDINITGVVTAVNFSSGNRPEVNVNTKAIRAGEIPL